MKLLVQIYLESNNFGQLIADHGVYASLSKNKKKISLNYDQIETKDNDELSWDCRGLILSKHDGSEFQTDLDGKLCLKTIVGDTKILAFGMRRFFNYGQGSASINWSDPNLAILEKLDGTLCIVYFDPWIDKWCVATRSVPEADIPLDNGIFTFRTLFEKALFDTCGKTFEEFTNGIGRNITYCFELTTPYNRIVVAYPNNRVTLLAVRKLRDLEEYDLNTLSYKKWVEYDLLDQDAKRYLISVGRTREDAPMALVDVPFNLRGVPIVQAHTYTSVSDLLNWVSSLNPIEHEGVVVKDSNFNRIKVKNAAYVAQSKLRDSLGTSERNCLELILLEKDDDVISMLPEEIVNNLKKIKEGLKIAIHMYDNTYDIIKIQSDDECPNDKKTFALNVNKIAKSKNLWTAPFFQRFDGKHSGMRDFINSNRRDGTWSDSFLDRLLSIAKSVDI